MKKTPKSKVASLYQFWNAQQQQQPQCSTTPRRSQDDVITLTDSPMEHLNVTPLSKTATPELLNKRTPSWAPLVRHSTTSDPSPAPKYIPAPLKHLSPASEADLEKAGFDPLEGSSIRYPANEYLRQFEMDIVKSCVSQNSAICLPLAVSADHICAIVTANFLRWFSRGRSVFCCDSLDAAQSFKERCVVVGIPADEVFIVDTFATFKKTPVHEVGRVIVTTPQTLEKIVESDSPVVSDIRCAMFCLDASENLRITKYKNIVGTLTVRKILFRVLLVTPSVPLPSRQLRKLGPLRKRQQVITSLMISQWIEPPASDLSFRNNAIPLGLSVDYIENVEVLSETRSFTEKWLERTAIYLESLNDLIPLPSTKPQDLFTIDWTQISAKASSCPDDTIQLVVNCMFLVESARNLIIHGPRVFYLYCVDLLGKAEKDSRAGNIALMVLGDPILSKAYEKIQTKYSYKTDCIFDITFSQLSLNSHPKYLRLKNLIDKSPSSLSCLVLCENDYVSRVVCESLDTSRIRGAIIRVLPQTPPPAFARHYCLPCQCSGLLSRKSNGLLIVASVNIPDITNVMDTLCSNRLHMVVSMDRRSICLLEGHTGRHVAFLDVDCEKLRPTDGRVIKVADELACRRSSLSAQEGVIERYDFSYAFSSLQLASSKMELVQYIPARENAPSGTRKKECTRRHGFELTSDEFSEYCDRLSKLPSVERGFYSKRRRFAVLNESPILAEKSFVNVSGDMPSGVLCKRLEEYMKGGDIIRRRLKRQFEYKDDLIDKRSIEFYSDMIAKLDRLLTI